MQLEALPFFLWHFYFSHSSSLFILHLYLPLLLSLHLFSDFDPGQTEVARMQVVLLLEEVSDCGVRRSTT